MSYLSWDEPERIEVVSGAFCMLRHSALDKVGLLDEDYFMYGEDIDLSFRLIKEDSTTGMCPRAYFIIKVKARISRLSDMCMCSMVPC